MATNEPTPLTRHRERLRQSGEVRVEVRVRKTDAALVRRVSAALSDPAREAHTRAALQNCLVDANPLDLRALLASAPLDDVDLIRSKDLGRSVDL